jgi:hypothetical protein
MVEEENISLSAADIQLLIAGGNLRRLPSGYWALTLSLDGEIAIDKERSLTVKREAHIGKLVQTGRRALPPHVQEALQAGLKNRWAKRQRGKK